MNSQPQARLVPLLTVGYDYAACDFQAYFDPQDDHRVEAFRSRLRAGFLIDKQYGGNLDDGRHQDLLGTLRTPVTIYRPDLASGSQWQIKEKKGDSCHMTYEVHIWMAART